MLVTLHFKIESEIFWTKYFRAENEFSESPLKAQFKLDVRGNPTLIIPVCS